MNEESDAELLARYSRVHVELARNIARRDRMKYGGARDRQSRWCGCLSLSLGIICAEIERRGLEKPR